VSQFSSEVDAGSEFDAEVCLSQSHGSGSGLVYVGGELALDWPGFRGDSEHEQRHAALAAETLNPLSQPATTALYDPFWVVSAHHPDNPPRGHTHAPTA
jgi:hypothetical protein